MRIVFLHPDLGLGGAERLIVDAAIAMKQKVRFIYIFKQNASRRRKT